MTDNHTRPLYLLSGHGFAHLPDPVKLTDGEHQMPFDVAHDDMTNDEIIRVTKCTAPFVCHNHALAWPTGMTASNLLDLPIGWKLERVR